MEKQVLNFENGLDMMGNDPELYQELLNEFLKAEQYNYNEITNLVAAGNNAEAGSIIHRLKGASATIGAELLQEVCSEAEGILRGKKEGNAVPLLPIIRDRYQALLPEIQKALLKLQ